MGIGISLRSLILLFILIFDHPITLNADDESLIEKMTTIMNQDQCKYKLLSCRAGERRMLAPAIGDCKDAFKAFKQLSQGVKSHVCPKARSPDCRHDPRKSSISWSCAFKCDLTSKEAQYYFTQRRTHPPQSHSKPLKDILYQIRAYQGELERIERRNNAFPQIWDL
ncbi:uncharacterized protein [Bemisia tabaci]